MRCFAAALAVTVICCSCAAQDPTGPSDVDQGGHVVDDDDEIYEPNLDDVSTCDMYPDSCHGPDVVDEHEGDYQEE